MAGRPIFAALSLLFTAGAIVLIVLTLLGGAVDSSGINKVFFLQVETSNIPNAGQTTRWTFWNHCDSDTSSAPSLCNGVTPAYPFDPPSTSNFDTEQNIPEQFLNTQKFYLLSRFMFAFVLIGIFFAICALFTGALALCTRVGAYLSGFLTMAALFFQALASILMTVAYIQGRDAFRANDQNASVGRYAFGFMWAAFACLVLSTVFFCLAGSKKRDSANAYSSSSSYKRKPGLFGGKRSRSTRSRGSLRKDYP